MKRSSGLTKPKTSKLKSEVFLKAENQSKISPCVIQKTDCDSANIFKELDILSVNYILPDPLYIMADLRVDARFLTVASEPERCQAAQKSLQ